MVSYREFFDLNQDFTLENLEKAYQNKISELEKLQIKENDKKFFIEQIKKLFDEAKFDIYHKSSLFIPFDMSNSGVFTHLPLFDDFNTRMNADSSKIDNYNFYSSASSYQSTTGPDEKKTIIEKNKINKNGKIDEKTYIYQIDKHGNKVPIKYDEALAIFNKQIDKNKLTLVENTKSNLFLPNSPIITHKYKNINRTKINYI